MEMRFGWEGGEERKLRPNCFLFGPIKIQFSQNMKKMGEKKGKMRVGQNYHSPPPTFCFFSSFCISLFSFFFFYFFFFWWIKFLLVCTLHNTFTLVHFVCFYMFYLFFFILLAVGYFIN